jgi:hypothetical protein
MVLAFTPVPFTEGLIDQPGTPAVSPPEGVGKQLCLLWFLAHDPRHISDEELGPGSRDGLADYSSLEVRLQLGRVDFHGRGYELGVVQASVSAPSRQQS